MFSDWTGTRIKSTALILFPLCLVLVNMSVILRLCLVNNDLMLSGLFPVRIQLYEHREAISAGTGKCGVPWFTRTFKVRAEKSWRPLGYRMMQEMKMNFDHEGLIGILTMSACGYVKFEVRAYVGEQWMSLEVITTFCCDIPE